jgi:hypothetical protein
MNQKKEWREALHLARSRRDKEIELFVKGRKRFESWVTGQRLPLGECVRLVEGDDTSPHVRITGYSHNCGQPGIWAVVDTDDLDEYLNRPKGGW